MRSHRLSFPKALSLCLFGLATAVLSSHTALANDSDKRLTAKLSLGQSWQVRNDVKIPNTDAGTRFSLANTVGEGPVNSSRFEVNWNFHPRHGVRIMLAPFEYTESVVFDRNIQFAGETFAANTSTDATYRFNSWRIGYHYTWINTDTTTFRIGATLKVRDAEIRLVQGGTTSFNDDVGLVPLLHLAGEHHFGNRWYVTADIDALGGGPGRAIDAGTSLGFKLNDNWRIGGEVRVLDGGADIESVFNFAQLNSASVFIAAEL